MKLAGNNRSRDVSRDFGSDDAGWLSKTFGEFERKWCCELTKCNVGRLFDCGVRDLELVKFEKGDLNGCEKTLLDAPIHA